MAKPEKPTKVRTWDDVAALVDSYFIVRDFISWRAMQNETSGDYPSQKFVLEILLQHALYKPKKSKNYGNVKLRSDEEAPDYAEEFDDRLTQRYLRNRTGLGISAVSHALAVLEIGGYITRTRRSGLPDIINVRGYLYKVAEWVASGSIDG